jgi:hypothetical protein
MTKEQEQEVRAFPESVEASIHLLLHLLHRCRSRVPDLLFDIAVAVFLQIQFQRIGRQPFDRDLAIRRQILFDDAYAVGLRSISNHRRRPPEGSDILTTRGARVVSW